MEYLDETADLELRDRRARPHPRARADAGRAGARQPGPARRERARRGARAVARHRPEAARGRARVLGGVDRAFARARTQQARRALPARPPLLGALARSRAREGMDDRADDRVVGRQRLRGHAHGDGQMAAGGRDEPARRPLRRRLHARAAGTRADARGLRPLRRAARARRSTRARYEDARDAALVDLQRHPELDHDEEIWVAFTERIVVGMGGAEPVSHDVAVELTSRWEHHENFELYEDVLPVLDAAARERASSSASSRTRRATCATSRGITRSRSTPASARSTTARRSRTRRSSRPCSTCSRSSPATRRWSATRSRTTSKARSRSACAPSSSTGSACTRTSSRASTTSTGSRQCSALPTL